MGGHVGGTYVLNLSGSWNGNGDLTKIPPGQLAELSRNILTHNGGAEKRGGTAVVGSAIAGTPRCLGIGQMQSAGGGSSYIYFVGSDGAIYRDGVSVASGLSTSAKRLLVPTPGKMFILSGADPVKVDTGAAIATIASPAADWTGANQPLWMLIHQRNGSLRGLAGGTGSQPTTGYYTAAAALENYSGGGTFNINVQEGHGIIGAVDVDDNALLFGREECFWFDDSSTSTAAWGTYRAAWKGGAYSGRLLLKARNFVFGMMEDGDIYRIDRAEQLRAYDRASITRPWFIHNWIRNNVDLSKIDNFFMEYDPQIDALKVFVTLIGESANTCALVYYLPSQDNPEGKWCPPHDATENKTASGYNASAGCQVQVGVGERRIYTGDYAGRTWGLEKTSKADEGAAYTGLVDSPQLDFENPRTTKLFLDMRLDYTSRGAYDIDVKPIVDDVDQSIQALTLAASGVGVGTFVLDTDVLGVVGVNSAGIAIGYEGKRMRLQFSNDGAGEDYFLSQALIDFNDLGPLPL